MLYFYMMALLMLTFIITRLLVVDYQNITIYNLITKNEK